ncbi:MAG TPA: hypothetical protein VI915_04750 [Thermoplasmata archaeon]|nr:hypothetical protein [Thermoplasmata archaeon]
MTYPQPPIIPGPLPTATGPSPYVTPYPAAPYGYPPPMEPVNSLVTTGSVLAILGGLVVGLGWVLDIAAWVYIVGIGWFMFGPGVGLALLGLGKQRAFR